MKKIAFIIIFGLLANKLTAQINIILQFKDNLGNPIKGLSVNIKEISTVAKYTDVEGLCTFMLPEGGNFDKVHAIVHSINSLPNHEVTILLPSKKSPTLIYAINLEDPKPFIHEILPPKKPDTTKTPLTNDRDILPGKNWVVEKLDSLSKKITQVKNKTHIINKDDLQHALTEIQDIKKVYLANPNPSTDEQNELIRRINKVREIIINARQVIGGITNELNSLSRSIADLQQLMTINIPLDKDNLKNLSLIEEMEKQHLAEINALKEANKKANIATKKSEENRKDAEKNAKKAGNAIFLLTIALIFMIILIIILFIVLKKNSDKQRQLNINTKQLEKEKETSERLRKEIQKKYKDLNRQNQQLMEKKSQIETLLEEAKKLRREPHHRVCNNLLSIKDAIEMQLETINDIKVRRTLNDVLKRIQCSLIVNSKLSNDSEDNLLNMKEVIESLCKTLVGLGNTKTRIVPEVKEENIEISAKSACEIGLMINELVTNAFKYAFKKIENGIIWINFEKVSDFEYLLEVADNGKGLPNYNIDYYCNKRDGFGLKLVNMLSKGHLELKENLEIGNGTKVRINYLV